MSALSYIADVVDVAVTKLHMPTRFHWCVIDRKLGGGEC